MKGNDWYYVPKFGLKDCIGILVKITNITDNPNYVDTEQWRVMKNGKYEHIGIFEETDSVYLTKEGIKVKPPSKVFDLLYSESVKNITTLDQTIDSEIDHDDFE